MITLDRLAVGDRARVIEFGDTPAPYRRKLLSLGLIPGAVLSVARLAPLGDPMEIRVRGFAMSLRRAEAAAIVVERL
jgi:ferrous iron transport protein A